MEVYVSTGEALSFGYCDCGYVPKSVFLSLYFSQRNGIGNIEVRRVKWLSKNLKQDMEKVTEMFILW